MDLAQMAGWFAAGAAIIAMLQKSDLRLKQGLIIHTVLYGIHFALLGLPTAVISCVIALARISLSIYTRSLLCAAVLIIISVATALAVSRSTVEILPLAASVVLTLSLFRFDGIKLRLGLLAGSVLWLIHNIYVQSWGGICLEACFCLSTLWGALDHGSRAKRKLKERSLPLIFKLGHISGSEEFFRFQADFKAWNKDENKPGFFSIFSVEMSLTS